MKHYHDVLTWRVKIVPLALLDSIPKRSFYVQFKRLLFLWKKINKKRKEQHKKVVVAGFPNTRSKNPYTLLSPFPFKLLYWHFFLTAPIERGTGRVI